VIKRVLQYSALCIALQSLWTQCSAVQCSAVKCSEVKCSAIQDGEKAIAVLQLHGMASTLFNESMHQCVNAQCIHLRGSLRLARHL
jgi:hypothetical protein